MDKLQAQRMRSKGPQSEVRMESRAGRAGWAPGRGSGQSLRSSHVWLPRRGRRDQGLDRGNHVA